MTRTEIEDAMETIGDAMDSMKKGTAEFMAASAEYCRLDDLLGDAIDAEIDLTRRRPQPPHRLPGETR